MIELQANIQEIEEAMRILSPAQVKKLTFSAFAKAEREMKTAASEHIRKHYTIKVKDFKKYIKSHIDMANMAVELRGDGPGFPMEKFAHSPRNPQPARRGYRVRVSMERGKSEAQPGHIFVARMKTGHVGIYKRDGDKRLGISVVYGKSVRAMLSSSDAEREILSRGSRVFQENFDSNMRREIGL